MRFLLLCVLVGTATASPKTTFELGRDRWLITAPAATHEVAGRDHKFIAKTWAVRVQAWPTSSVFVQTAEEELASMRKRDPDLVVIRQEKRSKSDWLLVVEMRGQIHGLVMRPGSIDNAMCTFELPAKQYQPALTACQSLEFARRLRSS